MRRLVLVVRLAFRHMLASPSTLLVGGIVLGISALIVVGGSLVGDMGDAVSRSVTDSISGDFQMYSAKSPDPLDLFAVLENLPPRLRPIPDFAAVKKTLSRVPNVRAVVPMGLSLGHISGESALDITLRRLRNQVRRRLDHQPVDPAETAALERHVRQIATVLLADFTGASAFFSPEELRENLVALQRASSDDFWQHFDDDPLAPLEFLDNRVAPQLSEGEPLDFGFLGTDLQAFHSAFGRFRVVDGGMVPPGRHGVLISKYYYEHKLKLPTARRLDEIHDARAHGHTIAKDPDLRASVESNQQALRELILQLDDLQSAQMLERLRKELGSGSTSLSELLSKFFAMDDGNFDARYAFFYKELAPMLQLYRARIGEPLTVRAISDRGAVDSLNLTIYGTFEFDGLQGSDTIGEVNLVDLESFRHLYGFPTGEDLAQEQQLRGELEALEAGKPLPTPGAEATAPVVAGADHEAGPVMNVAIALVDRTKADETAEALQRASDEAHLDLKLAAWDEVAGSLGQVAQFAGLALTAAIFLVLLVTLAIVNNAAMMTTLQRTREIGTIRAIGGQRRFVLLMVLTEAAVTTVVFGIAGSVLGLLVLLGLGKVGIPAPNEATNFLFGGARLFPTLHVGLVVVAAVVTLLAVLVSTLSPALFATRISPLRAMQAED